MGAGKHAGEGTLWHVMTRLLLLYFKTAPLQQAQQALSNTAFLLPMVLDLRAASSRSGLGPRVYADHGCNL